ncbi:hypothetical protein GCM10027275_30750 [Rhabdobacter roseus]|uniref:Uncharacterized protein n=1 Tax=Rhabdobacter roseus TaxID=1655419 RepID=A0A840TNV1_9BACT|nr:hypothetical protein [Rhabdobacter roseus]MBB5285034.1 hypothetical protein [Rhabdobacter roseus]
MQRCWLCSNSPPPHCLRLGATRQARNTIHCRGNSFYNVNKGKIYADIIHYLMTKLPAEMLGTLKEYYETPFI